MAISFSRPDPASPASVSSAQFPTTRKGYDQSEVRDFLRMVAAEQARLQERERFLERELRAAQQSAAPNMATIDEDTATRLLGEEAARVLTTAREAATQIRQRAEEGSARLLREATDEAQRLREEAEIEAARRRQDAAADSEAELQMAKQQGRDMVNEARAYRERVLSELARRRELARQQIEQLIHGRDRLLQAFERSRIAAVEVMAELTPLGEPDEYVNLQPTTGPVPIMVSGREPAGQPDLTLVPDLVDDEPDGTVALSLDALVAAQADDDGHPDVEDVVAADAIDEVTQIETDQSDDHDSSDTGSRATVESDEPDFFLDDSATPLDETRSAPVASAAVDQLEADGDTAIGEAADRDAADAVAADGAADVHDAGDAADGSDDNVVELFSTTTDPAGAGEPADEPSDASVTAAADQHPVAASGGTVNDLFARLRAARSDAVARKVSDAEPAVEASRITAMESDETIEILDADVVDAVVVDADVVDAEVDQESTTAPDPDEAVIPIIVSVARKLKRVLADEQNELLDTLRRKEPVRSIDALLTWEVDQADRYATAVESDLVLAAVAGAQGSADGRNPAIVRPAGDAVTNDIVAPLRDRLTRCIDKADGNNAELSNQVRSLYREWKTHRIDDHVETIVRLAFDRGALTVTTS